jgi:hypothetical protein
MKNKPQTEIQIHYDEWVKELNTQIHSPYDSETGMPIIGLSIMGPPKTGKILGEFQMTWNGFIYKWYENKDLDKTLD